MTLALRTLAGLPGVRPAVKRPAPVDVTFAIVAGVCRTLEGDVRYAAGDAIVRGAHDDVWPIARGVFDATYEATGGSAHGTDGRYVKRPLVVSVVQAAEPAVVALSDGRGQLSAAPGDWIVEHRPGDLAVVAGDIFERTYELLDAGDA